MKKIIIAFCVIVTFMFLPFIPSTVAIVNDDVEPSPSIVLREKPLTIKEYARQQAGADYEYLDFIISHESSWRPFVKNPTSSAFGLCQRMMKIHTEVDNYKTDPEVQIDWCINYAEKRYGSLKKAKDFWVQNNWW